MKRNKAAKEPAVPASTAENTAENGFYEVIYNGRRGYALAQYLSYCVVETSLKGG
mgnify:FL=1|jgi:hypothetical protein